MARESIGIDMDEVLADTVGSLLEEFNKKTELGVTLESLEGDKLRNVMPEHQAVIKDILASNGFFRRLKVIPDAVEVVKKLNEHYDIYIVTAAMDVPTSFSDKYDWLREHFAFLDPQHFVFCGRKNVALTDYLIDDNPKQLRIHTGKPLMFTAPHNVNETEFTRLNNWKEVEAYFLN
ncbi:5' nucleotidase, NT5C type [Staphylococcus massiliensis]|uniref:Putative 5'(3')-deoxyribonucleotidase n=1 Tax=Staphylococcus massiliensis S46 TaxID=1229783 RepID=K9B142_9STAP|nr:5'-3'-deoxyribonucleotidase [Staphylococcus massiliensis]EKU48542.1 hypothetical protein C273_05005 [Staphylococcus massiliensis S46]MCG3400095.1 5'(3')-deoxyribonucleotidase [Staphylococcus massiliensis]MCG3401817.1 5'(3')-deoxyribonucleotidase [Staphylococcus massiliensis]MCG3413150.1 5'(3')-deoxyribonucleotidase [Staphylococcus massiliensis]PNZ97567.1 5'(3')-deoxyribonucleotidase [Staphylococcus massiliensis CCUG 55927]